MICITADAPNPFEKRDSIQGLNVTPIMMTFPQEIPQVSINERTNVQMTLTGRISHE